MLPKIIFIVGYLFSFISLLLPYIIYDQLIFQPDVISPSSLASDTDFVKGAALISYKTFLGYISIIWMVYPLLKILRDSPDAIKQTILSALSLIAVYAILYYGLTMDPSWYKNYLNVRPSLGFWINVNGTFICLLSAIIMWLRKKQLAFRVNDNHDILDDPI